MSTPDNIEMTARIEAAAKGETPASAAPASPEVAPRRRGRPSNAEKAARDAQAKIDDAAGKNSEAPKSATKKKGPKADIDANKLAGQIKGLHIIAAKFTGMPFMQLSDAEAVALGESIAGVAEHYELTINPKTAATIQLLATAAMIYGPRALAFKAAKDAAQKSRGIPTTTENATDVSNNSAG